MEGKIYFQRDELPIRKLISKPSAGIDMHWFEKKFVFSDDNSQTLSEVLEATGG